MNAVPEADPANPPSFRDLALSEPVLRAGAHRIERSLLSRPPEAVTLR